MILNFVSDVIFDYVDKIREKVVENNKYKDE